MKPTQQVQFRTDSFSFLNLVIRYWKVLLIGGIGAFIISAALSLTITPLFRSTAILYPTTNVVETQTLFGLQSNATSLFGDESATEKVLQILRSDRIRKHLVEKFDLMKHYGIDENINIPRWPAKWIGILWQERRNIIQSISACLIRIL
jgi:uncharacterized protein involved in exopolysaccharide biosynthesis